MDILTEYLTENEVDKIINCVNNGDYFSLEKYVAFARKFINLDTSDEYVERILKIEHALIDNDDIVSLTKVVNSNHHSCLTFSTEKYESPINYAIIKNTPILADVIKLGKHDDFSPGFCGNCPVFTAIEYGNHKAFELIQDIAIKEKGRLATSNYYTCLQHATVLGDFELVKLIVEKYDVDLNETQGEKSPPLLLAVERGDAKIAKYLLEKGAYVNAVNEYGLTPLNCATGELVNIIKQFGGKEADYEVLLLHSIARNLDEGMFAVAESDFEKYIKISNVFVSGSTNLLESALLNGNVRIAREIIDNENASELLNTGLFNTCLFKNKGKTKNLKIINELLQLLIDKGLIFESSGLNYTIIPYSETINATMEDSFEFLDLLFKSGMLSNLDDEELMGKAVSAASYNFIRYMSEIRGVSLLEFDSKYGLIDYMFYHGTGLGDGDFARRKRLLDYYIKNLGADINRKDDMGNTVLHNFVSVGYYLDRSEWVAMLLVHGADPTIKNNHGQTPLDVAKAAGRPDTEINLLKGVVNIVSEDKL